METEYQQFGGANSAVPKRRHLTVVVLLVITCVLFVSAVIAAVVLGTQTSSSSSSSSSSSETPATTTQLPTDAPSSTFPTSMPTSSSSNSSTTYCASTACLELAADLAKSINSSVDPCHDFYHYACDGWDDDNSWINIRYRYSQYDVTAALDQRERETFIDALFYNTKEELVGYDSVRNAQAYFQTCYESTSDLETLGASEWVAFLVNQTTFYDLNSSTPNTWTQENAAAFQQALTFLTRIHWNPFFTLNPADTKLPGFVQFIEFWSNADEFNASRSYFIPLYEQVLHLNANQSAAVAASAYDLMSKILNIVTIFDASYDAYDTSMTRFAAFSNLSTIFEPNYIMNYSKLVYDVYDISPSDPELMWFKYLSGGVSYFRALPGVLEQAGPMETQYFLWTAMFYFYLNFQDTYSQTRYTDRTEWCIDSTINKFPFVYGYILFNTMYDEETNQLASTLTSTIKDDGLKILIENATWLDDDSKAAALKKVEHMALYIGFPPRIKDPAALDIYYRDVSLSTSLSWIQNVELFTRFDFKVTNQTFWGFSYNLTAGWPSDFEDANEYDSWLTGINAFYTPWANWFTVPATIAQPLFLIADGEIPSAWNFGNLGASTCGHEMSHGFDPSGTQYNYNGTYVGSIFSNYSQQQYADKMTCFKDQYSSIVVDHTANGAPAYDDGNRTITENVADNVGLASAWVAWQAYLAQNGNDNLLYGVELTQEQLFFVGYAFGWCTAARPGSNLNLTDVHSPAYARVIGPMQNSAQFSEAFGCKAGDRMNPTNKCTVW